MKKYITFIFLIIIITLPSILSAQKFDYVKELGFKLGDKYTKVIKFYEKLGCNPRIEKRNFGRRDLVIDSCSMKFLSYSIQSIEIYEGKNNDVGEIHIIFDKDYENFKTKLKELAFRFMDGDGLFSLQCFFTKYKNIAFLFIDRTKEFHISIIK